MITRWVTLASLAPFVFPAWRQMRRPDPVDADADHLAPATA